MVSITPGKVITVFQPQQTGIVAKLESSYFRIVADKIDGLMVNIPRETIFTLPKVKIHYPASVISSKYTDELAFIWNNSAVEDAV
jgi:hypothetical protein